MASANSARQLPAELSRTSQHVKETVITSSTRTSSPLSAVRPPQSLASTSFSNADEKPRDHITVEVRDDFKENLSVEDDDPLKTFHTALGIPPPKPVKLKPKRNVLGRKKPIPPQSKQPKQPKVSAANKGVYKNVLYNERQSRYVYQACDLLLTICMFLQIIVGAAVTAFGAGSANHIIITVFGAANTALASLLAVLKSKGLPNRLRQDWNGWRELREYIEEKEREIDMRMQGHGEGLPPLDIWSIVRDIEGRYQTMRLTLEANRPDTYIRVPPSMSLPK